MRKSMWVAGLSVFLLCGFSGDDDAEFVVAQEAAYAFLLKATPKADCTPVADPVVQREALRLALTFVDKPGHRGIADGTPMLYAAMIDDVVAMKRFAELGDSLTQGDNVGGTPLHIAAQFGATEAIDWLLANGVAVDIADDHGTTPLMVAAGENHLPAVNRLLAAGANVNARTAKGRGLLAYAMLCHDPKMIATLRNAGAPVDDFVRMLAARRGIKLD